MENNATRLQVASEKPRIVIQRSESDVDNSFSRGQERQSIVERFFHKTTIHGISHMWSENNNKLHCSLWFIIMIISFCTLVYFIIYVLLNYLSFDVIGNTNVHMKVPMDLPTITFCNMNSYKGKMDYTIDQMLLYCQYENTRCRSDDFIQFKISTYKCYSFNSGRDSSGHPVELYKSSKKGFLYGVTLKLFAGFPEEANLYLNGFLVFVQ